MERWFVFLFDENWIGDVTTLKMWTEGKIHGFQKIMWAIVPFYYWVGVIKNGGFVSAGDLGGQCSMTNELKTMPFLQSQSEIIKLDCSYCQWLAALTEIDQLKNILFIELSPSGLFGF